MSIKLKSIDTILYSNKDPQVTSEHKCAFDKFGLELVMCSKWLVDDKLSLHMGKTECIIFGSKGKLRKIRIFSVLHILSV